MSYLLERELFGTDLEFEDELEGYDFELEAEIDRNSREYIKWVQRSLNQVINAGLAVDGIRGPRIRNAVASFQKKAGIKVDGTVGLQTEQALIRAGTSAPPNATPSSQPQTPLSSRAVSLNRYYGRQLGWDAYFDRIGHHLKLTKSPEPVTFASAIARWQRQNGLKDDGILGPGTWTKMRVALGLFPEPRVNTPLPSSGPGFYSQRTQTTQFGLPETIQALKAIGAAWHKARPQGPRIGIGDISLRGGGPIKNHVSHQKGVDVDIWLVTNDGTEAPIRYQSPKYSQALTQKLVNLIHSNGVLRVQYIFFNDPKVKGVRPWKNHDNHLHVRFYPPKTTP